MLTKSELEQLHNLSSKHKKSVMQSVICGCFYCITYFTPEDILEWCDDEETALCPKCGIDSVIGDKDTRKITKPNLNQMHDKYF